MSDHQASDTGPENTTPPQRWVEFTAKVSRTRYGDGWVTTDYEDPSGVPPIMKSVVKVSPSDAFSLFDIPVEVRPDSAVWFVTEGYPPDEAGRLTKCAITWGEGLRGAAKKIIDTHGYVFKGVPAAMLSGQFVSDRKGSRKDKGVPWKIYSLEPFAFGLNPKATQLFVTKGQPSSKVEFTSLLMRRTEEETISLKGEYAGKVCQVSQESAPSSEDQVNERLQGCSIAVHQGPDSDSQTIITFHGYVDPDTMKRHKDSQGDNIVCSTTS